MTNNKLQVEILTHD